MLFALHNFVFESSTGSVRPRRPFRHSLILVLVAVALVFLSACGDRAEPVVEASVEHAESSLPAGAILLEAGAATNVTAPFMLKADSTAAAGTALVIKEGHASKDLSGHTEFEAKARVAGPYAAWLHVRWLDSCGNSVSIGLSDNSQSFVAQDASYGRWHWVYGGELTLRPGSNTVVLAEREDGIAIDQIFLIQDKEFAPVIAFRRDGVTELRYFGDDFARSPGHGAGNWKIISGEWEIAFSLDPNRIPNQYAWVGNAAAGASLSLVDAPPWNGCRFSTSLCPLEEGLYGIVLGRSEDDSEALKVSFEIGADSARLHLNGAGIQLTKNIGDAFRLRQWHRIVVERWAWVVRVMVDDRLLVADFDATPRAGAAGLFVDAGQAAFDDVTIEDIPWQAEDNDHFKIDWQPGAGSEWHRQDSGPAGMLAGRNGDVSSTWHGMGLAEVVLDEIDTHAGNCTVSSDGLVVAMHEGARRVFRSADRPQDSDGRVTLSVAQEEVRIRRLALRYERRREESFHMGPYHFSQTRVPDPSDYLDFTPEEYREIERSPDAQKLRRRQKYVQVLGGSGSLRPIVRQGWRIRNGILANTRPGARLRHQQEIVGPFELHMKLRLHNDDSVVKLSFYAGDGAMQLVRITGVETPSAAAVDALSLYAPAGQAWHDVVIRTDRAAIEAQIDGAPPRRISASRGQSGRMFLEVTQGLAEFDDIEFKVPRQTGWSFMYAFDRRECDWWRTGDQWLDHGGIACALASHWVSLIAPGKRGMLWNKRTFASDVVVAFNIQENTEWLGWNKNPSHIHYPFDNVVVVLGREANIDSGYRLEVNARNRSATVLYREDKEVARAKQSGGFPMRYAGGHVPYSPRISRISFIKQGSRLRAIINGKEVLAYDDSVPVSTSRVGIGGVNTRINFSYVEVLEPPAAP